MSVTVARSLDEALETLARVPQSMVLAGGTDAMVEINFGHRRPQHVVAVDRIPELNEWRSDGSTLRIGAGVTYAALEAAPFERLVTALAHAARTVGSPQIRNAGTLGGNVAMASPAGDTLPVLAALDASIELHRVGEVRVVPWHEFFVGPKKTTRRDDELVVAILVPVRRGPQAFLKVGTRNAMVIAVASVCLVIDLDERTVRCGLGAVGPVPLRAPAAEAWVADQLVWTDDHVRPRDPALSREFGRRVGEAARPIDDHRGTAAFRRHAISVCAARALGRAFDGGLQGGKP
ncbi:MAG: xanthine dehydrogenase family protein subunit M [Acidimicrobiales bacterium]